MLETPGDLVLDLQCVQQASYLEGGPLLWILPLYLHVNQNTDDDDDDDDDILFVKYFQSIMFCLYNIFS